MDAPRVGGLDGFGLSGLARRAGDDPVSAGLASRQESFLDLLNRSRRVSSEDEARDAAEDLVAITFVEPILKDLRENSNAAPPFGPAPGEREFGALRDAEVARRLVRAARFPLVERLARDLRGAPA